MSRKLLPLVIAFALICGVTALISLPVFAGRVRAAILQANVGAHAPITAYVVNNLDDTNDGACNLSHCSLREAITLANSNAGADTITFSVSGTITLTSTLPPISDTLTIDGSGHATTIDGASAHQIMHVNNGAALTLNALTVANGSSGNGGGIDNEGTLTVTDSTLAGNYASVDGGGIFNGGALSIISSTLSRNMSGLQLYGQIVKGGGGGVYNGGTLTIMNSTFSGNNARGPSFGQSAEGDGGGAIYNGGASTITNSTFSGNYVAGFIFPYCCVGSFIVYGGGISNQGTLTIGNSTLSGSTATMFCEDATHYSGTLTGTHSSFGGTGVNYPFPAPCECPPGGCDIGANSLYNSGAATFRNTIVATSPNRSNCNGAVANGGNNLDSAASCGWGSNNGSLSNTDPHLAGLADNGGISTMRLWPDSPAIDGVTFNAPNDCPATDQRGVARPIGPRCDIGAFEANVTQHAYLPDTSNNFVNAPDLIVNSLIASTHAITVVIQNTGPAPVVDEFWVDAYVDPQPAPTGVNQVWNDGRSTQGMVWGITASALPLQPGDLLTLTLSSPYYRADLSHLVSIAPGTSVYAQVDSADMATTYGAVLESHEVLNGLYNNILGPVLFSLETAGQIPALITDRQRSGTGQLPRRPGQ